MGVEAKTNESNGLRPLEDLSLADQAYNALREAILALALHPGEPLIEQKIAQALGTSKTPIRQALHRLEQTGLVRVIPGKGYYVAPLSIRDAREILEIRAVLEGLSAELACSRLTDEEREELGQRLQSAQDAYEAGQMDIATELGHQFHQLLIEKADNERLTLLIGVLSDQYRRVRLLSNQNPGRLSHSIPEHAAILDALIARDPVRAGQAMRRHLLAVYEDLEIEQRLPQSSGPIRQGLRG